MAFLRGSRTEDLSTTSALEQYFEEAFANSMAAQQGRSPALSTDELCDCLALIASQDYTRGIDPQSGRAYYVHSETRAPTWEIDVGAVDASLGRIFDNSHLRHPPRGMS